MNDSLLDELPSLSFEVMKRHAKNICKCYGFDICPSPPHILSASTAQVVKLSRHGGLRASLAAAKTAASCPFRIFGIWHMTIGRI